jgi:signal transduction histidine kinase
LATAGFLLCVGSWGFSVIPTASPALLATVASLMAASAVMLLMLDRTPRPSAVARLLCVLDAALVTGAVAATGAGRSMLVCLYVVLVVGACLLLSRWGALAVALASSGLYTALLVGREVVPAVAFDEPVHRLAALDVLAALATSGTIILVSLVAGSLRERDRRSQRQLERQADRLATLGRLAANMAHQVRNPVASLSGAAEALAGRDMAADTRARLAEIVVRESGRLSGLIGDFLEYAHPTPLHLEPIDAALVLDDVLDTLPPRLCLAGVKIVRAFPPSLRLEADRVRFRQVVSTVCSHALAAMREGGELRVEAQRRKETVEITVTDTGPGIAPEALGHAFEPFFPTRDGATGLGLALVHRIVQEHGGEVTVRSDAGVGAEFTLCFPERHA